MHTLTVLKIHDSMQNGIVVTAGGLGWTMLHQAALWQASKQVLVRLKDVGADPMLVDWNGRTPAEILSDREVGIKERPTRTVFKKYFAEVFEPPGSA